MSEQRFVVVGAKIRCTGMVGTSESELISGSSGETVNGAVLVTHKDIEFSPHFEKCEKTEEPCVPDIEDGQWIGYCTRNQSNGNYRLPVNDVYMFCRKGPGLLYITDDGETPASSNRDVLSLIRLGRSILVNAFDGDPVNMATGNFIYSHTDLHIGGTVPLSFKRFYNSQSRYKGALGEGWTHNYEIKIIKDLLSNDVSILFDDGRQERFWTDIGGAYVPFEESGASLTRLEKQGGYLLEYPNKSSYYFDEEGKIILHKDVLGNYTKYFYDGRLLNRVSSISGELYFFYESKELYSIAPVGKVKKNHASEERLIMVRDHSGREIQFKYDYIAFNTYVLSACIDTRGNSYQYFYDNMRFAKLINKDGVCVLKNEYDVEDRIIKQSYADDSVMEFEYDAHGNVTFTERNGSRMIYEKDRIYRTTAIKYPNGWERFYYNDKNQVVKIIDRNSNKADMKFDEQGNLISITNFLGSTTEYDYGSKSQLEKIAVDGHKKNQMKYDEKGNLLTIEDALEQKTTIAYTENQLPEKITRADGSTVQLFYDERRNIIQIVDGIGICYKYQYDSLNRVIKAMDGNENETNFQYDTEGNITAVKNALGDIRTYTYNERNLMTEFIDFDGGSTKREYGFLDYPTKIIDKLGRETRFFYDSMWNLAKITEPNGAEVIYKYNLENQLESIQKPDKSMIQYEYDRNGNRTSMIDEEGYQVRFVYDALNQLIEVFGEEGLRYYYTYDANGKVINITDALGNTVSFVYDVAGQLIEERNPLGENRIYTYTPLGDVSTITDEAGRQTRYEYKPGGQLLKIYHPDKTSESFAYDNNGNIKFYTNRIGNKKEYHYDLLNRIIKMETILPGEISKNEKKRSSKSFTYDAVGNVTTVTDEEGYVTTYEYTLTGKLSKAIDYLGSEVIYDYDCCDRLVEIRHFDKALLEKGKVVDYDIDFKQVVEMNKGGGGVRATQYQRNIIGQIEKVTDAFGKSDEYRYDGKGQLVEKLDKDGYLTKYGYTPHGDLSYIQYADGKEAQMSYDPLRRLKQVKDWLGTTDITYDKLGRVVEVSNHNNHMVRYDWGTGNIKKRITYPDGKEIKYEYDDLLRLEKVIDGDRETSYRYNHLGYLVEKRYPNNFYTEYEYEHTGRLKRFSHKSLEKYLDSYVFDYDSKGNKIRIEKNREGLPEESERMGRYLYKYDALNRLQEVYHGEELLKAYSYDGYGNRTSMVEKDKVKDYVYNPLNQLVSISEGDVHQSYSYDNRGNLVKIHKNSNLSHQYHFGSLNRLEEVINHEKQLGATYRYNGLGHRTGKTEGRITESVLFQTPYALAESLGKIGLSSTKEIDDVLDITKQYNNLLQRKENQDITSFIWDLNVLSFNDGASGYQQYLQDELGSPIRLVDDKDMEQEVFRYDDFGQLIEGDIASNQPFTYTGYQVDHAAETYYAQAREYDPKTSRMISEDPYWKNYNPNNTIVPNINAIIESNNLYVYASNNPIRFTDPLGLWSKDGHERLTRTALFLMGVMRPDLAGMFYLHADFIVLGNRTIDYDYPAWWVFGDNQSRHFNKNAVGWDSRIVWWAYYFGHAMMAWRIADLRDNHNAIMSQLFIPSFLTRSGQADRERALVYVGRGLHSIQDMGAHLDFGVSSNYRIIFNITPVHRVQGEGLSVIRNAIFDNPRYDVFRDSNGNWQSRDSGSAYGSDRWANSINDTKNYLIRFYEEIGVW